MDVYGVKLIGINAHTGEKLIFSLVLLGGFLVARLVLGAATDLLFAGNRLHRFRFWTRHSRRASTSGSPTIGLNWACASSLRLTVRASLRTQ